MLDTQAISMNNLTSPEHIDLLMFMLDNHPIEPVGPGYANQIVNDGPGRYTLVVRFRGVGAVAIGVGKALDPEVAGRIENALAKNQRELGPLADRHQERWRNRMVTIHALREKYRKQIMAEECPYARSRLQDEREDAVEEKMQVIRKELEPSLHAAFPLYKHGVSWPQFVQTVLTQMEQH